MKEGGITTIEWRKPIGALEKVLPGTLMARANDGVITYVGESKEGVAAQAHEYDPSIDTLISEEEKKIEDEVFQGPFGRSMFDGLTSAEEAEAEAAARNRYADRHYGERYEVVNGRLRVEDISRDGGTTRSTMTKSEIEDKKRERTDLTNSIRLRKRKRCGGRLAGNLAAVILTGCLPLRKMR